MEKSNYPILPSPGEHFMCMVNFDRDGSTCLELVKMPSFTSIVLQPVINSTLLGVYNFNLGELFLLDIDVHLRREVHVRRCSMRNEPHLDNFLNNHQLSSIERKTFADAR